MGASKRLSILIGAIMSTVRMSRELHSTILNQAMSSFDIANPEPKQTNELEAYLRAAIPQMPSQKAAQRVMDMIQDYKNTLSFGFNKIKIDRRNIQNLTVYEEATRDEKTISLDLNTPIAALSFIEETYYRQDIDKLRISDLLPEHQNKVRLSIGELLQSIETYKNSRREYRTKINDLLTKCNTLKQLLDVWPAAENLVPSHYMSKLYEKVTRKQRAAAVREQISFDQDEVNQVVLTAKLIGNE